MSNKTLTQADLQQFTGSEEYYQHPLFKGYTYTDGVRFVAQQACAYWLIEAILSWQCDAEVRREPFQHWTLTVAKDASALLKVTDGNADILAKQKFSFTDFPLEEISFYLCDTVLILPSEY
jgi:hypothetical protein